MGILITLMCLVFVLLVWDVRLRISHHLYGRRHYDRFARAQAQGARYILAAARLYAGFKVIIDSALEGPLPAQFMILSNHQSLADIPILAYVFARHMVGFVAKRELRHGIPAVSVALRKGKHALISRRGAFSTARRELVKMARYAREGVCPVVFPEGTRSRSGRVRPFHSAAVRTILNEQAMPIISVAVDGGYRIAGIRGLATNLVGCIYRVKLLSMYSTTRQRSGIKEIVDSCHGEISEQVEQWRRIES
jgi:1-acyl-sn-glycerol-3-phosphate acyltransferase